MSNGKTIEKDEVEIRTGPHCKPHGNYPDSLITDTTHIAHPGGLSHLTELVRTLSSQDAEARYLEEAADDGIPYNNSRDGGDGSGGNLSRKVIISWEKGDKENPHNWTGNKRRRVLLTTMAIIINSTLGSSLPSMAIPYMTKEWGVTDEEQMPLPIATFLMGFVLGPMTWGPLSEHYGRRIVILVTFFMFTIWTMACALAPNWPAFLVFRFLCGAFASAPIAVVAGVIADIYSNTVTRGRAMAYFMATTVWGPLFAPIISGFCSTSIGWRWTFWIGLIYAGLTFVPIILLPETYAPVLLTRKAAALRARDPPGAAPVYYAAAELEPRDLKQLATVVLTRPLRMLLTELIVSSVCAYLALVYAIFYMSFQAFPRVFQDLYGLSPGVTGLCFLPIGAGCLLGIPIFFAYDHVMLRARKRGGGGGDEKKSWARQEEYRRVPLACLGGPLFAASLFWLGWSAPRTASATPLVVPLLAGVPFGLGFTLIFMALLNYLTDAYEAFSASANAAASACRSLVAVVLPFATAPLFARLGVAGACSLLGGLSALMCAIPFVFLWKGEQIRAGSRFCAELRRRKAEMETRAAEAQGGASASEAVSKC